MTNSRPTTAGQVIWRRRQCLSCKHVFTTEESLNPENTWKITSPNGVEAYSRARLALSLIRACDHRVHLERSVWYLLKIIEQKAFPLAAKNGTIIPAAEMGNLVAEVLKNFDPAAYIKYLSHRTPHMDARALRKHLKRANP